RIMGPAELAAPGGAKGLSRCPTRSRSSQLDSEEDSPGPRCIRALREYAILRRAAGAIANGDGLAKSKSRAFVGSSRLRYREAKISPRRQTQGVKGGRQS